MFVIAPEFIAEFDSGSGLDYSQSTSCVIKLYYLIHLERWSHSQTGKCILPTPPSGWKKSTSFTGVIVCERNAKEMWKTREQNKGLETSIKHQKLHGHKDGTKE